MTRILNTRIVASLAMIVFVGAIAASATGAFFSDTETSTGNTFTAGDIDLRIDNESYVTDASGNLVASPENSWAISDLTNQLFFSFNDVKPGDIGEDTISIHAGSNDAYACMALDITGTPENTLTDPEEDANDVGPADGDNGELQNYLEFAWWADDGDNVFEVGEEVGWTGRAGEIFDGRWQRLVDSTGGMLGDNPITGGSTVYIAKAWCFGELTQAPVAVGDGTPIGRGTGFTCNGAGDGDQNDAQTDGVVVDVSFYAVQTRNNSSFRCADLPPFVGEGGEQRQLVGAEAVAYVAPSCNATVSGGASIQSALNVAAENSTVCVDETYTGAGDSAASRIETAGVTLAATTQGVNLFYPVVLSADGVTVTGFDGFIGQAESPSEVAAFYLDNDATNATISHNTVVGSGSGAAILTETGASLGGGLIANNVLSGALQGIYLNPHTGLITIEYNDIENNVVGIGNLTGALVRFNEFDHTSAAQEAIGAGNGANGDYDGSVVEFNNFLGDTRINTYTLVGDVDAENNFFGPNGGAAQAPADVDFTPEAGSAYPHN